VAEARQFLYKDSVRKVQRFGRVWFLCGHESAHTVCFGGKFSAADFGGRWGCWGLEGFGKGEWGVVQKVRESA
jgi:hypothetical protein